MQNLSTTLKKAAACGQDERRALHEIAPRAFVLGVDVVADVQVQVGDLQVVGRLAHVVGAEQLGHGGALVRRR